LGGIPMGVIVTENRTSEALKPADPADSTSQEKMVQQAGGVWFPDSAYKTAQALKDFNREGLPCIIFANWRGFSGGQRDMFDEVLKFGSMIVDALVAYKQPLFVYIPPFAELRGGAWVVVDSTINSDVMEFYAAEDARGGVLEATGAASIKFRDRDIISTAHRLDHVLIALDNSIGELKAALLIPGQSAEDVAEIKTKVAEAEKQSKMREKMLFGVFQQVAVHFADLHDTPGRMRAKGVIKKQVQWKESRTFFYWRLRRRLAEFELASTISAFESSTVAPSSRREILASFQSWFSTTVGNLEMWEDDRLMMAWVEGNAKKVQEFIVSRQVTTIGQSIERSISQLVQLTAATSGNSIDAIRKLIDTLPAEHKEILTQALH